MGSGNVAVAGHNLPVTKTIAAMNNTCPATMPAIPSNTSALRRHRGQDASEAQSLQWVARFHEKTAHYLGLPWPLPLGAGHLPPPALKACAAATSL